MQRATRVLRTRLKHHRAPPRPIAYALVSSYLWKCLICKRRLQCLRIIERSSMLLASDQQIIQIVHHYTTFKIDEEQSTDGLRS